MPCPLADAIVNGEAICFSIHGWYTNCKFRYSDKAIRFKDALNNGHVRLPDTTKHESFDMAMPINSFQINARGLRPTTNNESLDMPLADNSFQIKKG